MDMSSQPMLTDDDDAQPLITNRMTQAQPIIPQRASAMNKRRQSVAAIGVGAKIEVSLNIIKISFTHEVICALPTNRKINHLVLTKAFLSPLVSIQYQLYPTPTPFSHYPQPVLNFQH